MRGMRTCATNKHAAQATCDSARLAIPLPETARGVVPAHQRKKVVTRARLPPLLGRRGLHRRALRGERGLLLLEGRLLLRRRRLLLLELPRRFLRRRLPGRRAFDANGGDR